MLTVCSVSSCILPCTVVLARRRAYLGRTVVMVSDVISMPQIAATLSEVTGKTIVYSQVRWRGAMDMGREGLLRGGPPCGDAALNEGLGKMIVHSLVGHWTGAASCTVSTKSSTVACSCAWKRDVVGTGMHTWQSQHKPGGMQGTIDGFTAIALCAAHTSLRFSCPGKHITKRHQDHTQECHEFQVTRRAGGRPRWQTPK